MNNKWSFHILVAFLLIASACKSEVKTNAPATDDTVVNEQITDAVSQDDASQEVTEVAISTSAKNGKEEKPTREVKEVKKPKQKTEVKKPKAQVDKGIQIEMGMEDTDGEAAVQEENENDSTSEPTVKEPENEKNEEEEVENSKPSKPAKVDKILGFPKHTSFAKLLKTHVSPSGVVNYAALKGDEAQLDSYLKLLEGMPPATTWSSEQELAYWINAYNAYTLKLILDNYPVKSITDLHGGKPWDVKWINIDGKSLSLNNIENDIIRPKFNEPRIHFAVNCAAKSCPPLLNDAYVDSKLNAQLESQTKKFINNASFNTLSKNEIEVSKIFEWYKVDFGDIASFVLRYANTTVKPGAVVKFKEYDWALNGK
ncbi:MAG: DUF547 domain-containing protein [Bacteroidota bacterium]